MIGKIFDIKEMAVHDGPGIRTTVFFKGCPLRCDWCHNPEGFTTENQLMYKSARCLHCNACKKECEHEECKSFGRCIYACPENLLSVSGRDVTVKGLVDELKKSAEPLGEMFGGFTFSGGEPLMQAEFLLSLCDELKNYHLCIETSGFADSQTFIKVIQKLDFIIMDIKLADSELHKKYTGVENELILKNFEILKNSGKPYIIRTPHIPNITDTEDNLNKIKDIIGESVWEHIPYNAMTGAKYKNLGLEFNLEDEILCAKK